MKIKRVYDMLSKLKVLPISSGLAGGKIVYYRAKSEPINYQNKIVLIEDLDASEIIPLIKKSKGVIAERGGITGHGAVLLREFKLPAILLPKARGILKEGEKVLISDQGFIEIPGKVKIRQINLEKEIEVKLIKKGDWFLAKPKTKADIVSRFTDSFVQEGLLATPQVLLNIKQKAIHKFDQRGIWIKNHPTPQGIALKILDEPKWFEKHRKGQRKIFTELRKYEKKIKKKFDSGYKFALKEAYQELLNCRDWFTKTRPYIFLFAYSIDVMEKKFYKLATSFLSSPEATKLFDQIARSAYAKKIYQSGIEKPRIPKTPKFPPSPLLFIEAKPNYRRKVRLTKNLKSKIKKQPKSFQKLFLRYLKVLPTIVEVNDEVCYACRFFLTALTPRFLQIIARYAIELNLLKKKEDILKLTIKEIEKLVHKISN